MRLLTNEEMFNLPDDWKANKKWGWENPMVDVTQYKPSIMLIWEVEKEIYEKWKEEGGLCLEYKNRFYVA